MKCMLQCLKIVSGKLQSITVEFNGLPDSLTFHKNIHLASLGVFTNE